MPDNLTPDSRSDAVRDIVVAAVVYVLVRAVLSAIAFRPFGTVASPGTFATVAACLALGLRPGGFPRLKTTLGISLKGNLGRIIIVTIATIAVTAVVANLLQPWFARVLGPYTIEAGEKLHELHGNLTYTLLTLVLVAWVAAAVGEEVIFRGVLLLRLGSALGGSRAAIAAAWLIQAGAFAAVHLYQGSPGAAMAGTIGLIFGAAVLGARRSLLPAILVHAIPDTIAVIHAYHG
jgi:membrane protease YdiL (CAAX protease family)